jgi:hypothetical protein
MRVWNEQAAQFLAHHFVCTATDRLNRHESKNKRTAFHHFQHFSWNVFLLSARMLKESRFNRFCVRYVIDPAAGGKGSGERQRENERRNHRHSGGKSRCDEHILAQLKSPFEQG